MVLEALYMQLRNQSHIMCSYNNCLFPLGGLVVTLRACARGKVISCKAFNPWLSECTQLWLGWFTACHSRYVLTCPSHSLAYEIECHERAAMSKHLVYPIFNRSHSNWLEASHNVFICFRPKHIFLERLHYVLSTELALLQSNMMYMY